jgi:DNA-directed RNA polymerase subunit beta
MIERKSYSRIERGIDLPNLLEIQTKSYEEFLQPDTPPHLRKKEGLHGAFLELFPVDDVKGYFRLEYDGYKLGIPKYSLRECKERGMTYAAPLKVDMSLLVHELDGETKRFKEKFSNEVYIGEIPLMTERGTFVINGAERVIVSQLHRSPGITFDKVMHPNGKELLTARIIPKHGSWIEILLDVDDVLTINIDRKKKMPATVLLRAFGYSSDEDILDLFLENDRVKLETDDVDRLVEQLKGKICKKNIRVTKSVNVAEESKELIKARCAERVVNKIKVPVSVNVAAESKKLINEVCAEPVADEETGEILADAEEALTADKIKKLTESGVKNIKIYKEETGEVLADAEEVLTADKVKKLTESGVKNIKIYEYIVCTGEAFTAERIKKVLEINEKLLEIYKCDTTNERDRIILETWKKDDTKCEEEALFLIYASMRLGDPPNVDTARNLVQRAFFDGKRYDLGNVGRYRINTRLKVDPSDESTTLHKEDIVAALKYMITLATGGGFIDDIDHLGNRRVRSVGELLKAKFTEGLMRMVRTAKERFSTRPTRFRSLRISAASAPWAPAGSPANAPASRCATCTIPTTGAYAP